MSETLYSIIYIIYYIPHYFYILVSANQRIAFNYLKAQEAITLVTGIQNNFRLLSKYGYSRRIFKIFLPVGKIYNWLDKYDQFIV